MELKRVNEMPTKGSFIAVWVAECGTLETASYCWNGGKLYCHDATLAEEQPADLFYEYFRADIRGVAQFLKAHSAYFFVEDTDGQTT